MTYKTVDAEDEGFDTPALRGRQGDGQSASNDRETSPCLLPAHFCFNDNTIRHNDSVMNVCRPLPKKDADSSVV